MTIVVLCTIMKMLGKVVVKNVFGLFVRLSLAIPLMIIGTCLDLATLPMPTIHIPMPKYLVQDLAKEGGKIGWDKIAHFTKTESCNPSVLVLVYIFLGYYLQGIGNLSLIALVNHFKANKTENPFQC